MFRLLSSTTVDGQTAAMISSLETRSPARPTRTPRTSSARAPSAIGRKTPRSSRRNRPRQSRRKPSNRKMSLVASAAMPVPPTRSRIFGILAQFITFYRALIARSPSSRVGSGFGSTLGEDPNDTREFYQGGWGGSRSCHGRAHGNGGRFAAWTGARLERRGIKGSNRLCGGAGSAQLGRKGPAPGGVGQLSGQRRERLQFLSHCRRTAELQFRCGFQPVLRREEEDRPDHLSGWRRALRYRAAF